jgi:hypothetical protein
VIRSLAKTVEKAKSETKMRMEELWMVREAVIVNTAENEK